MTSLTGTLGALPARGRSVCGPARGDWRCRPAWWPATGVRARREDRRHGPQRARGRGPSDPRRHRRRRLHGPGPDEPDRQQRPRNARRRDLQPAPGARASTAFRYAGVEPRCVESQDALRGRGRCRWRRGDRRSVPALPERARRRRLRGDRSRRARSAGRARGVRPRQGRRPDERRARGHDRADPRVCTRTGTA